MTQLELIINLSDWIDANGIGEGSLHGFLCAYATSLEEFTYLQHELQGIFEVGF